MLKLLKIRPEKSNSTRGWTLTNDALHRLVVNGENVIEMMDKLESSSLDAAQNPTAMPCHSEGGN